MVGWEPLLHSVFLEDLWRKKNCIDLAEKLLDSIVRNIKKDMSIYFSNGLCGICWGIDFLLNEGFFSSIVR